MSTKVPRFEHGSRVPGWDDAVDLTKPPAVIPDPAITPVPETLREEIEAAMAKYPDRRSAAIPALHAAQRVHGWCSPTAIDQVAAVMALTPAYLTSVASFYDMLELEPRPHAPRRLRVHEHLVLAAAAPTSSSTRCVRAAGGRRGHRRALVRVPRRLRHRPDGLGQRRVRRARSSSPTPSRSSTTCAPAAPVLRGKQLRCAAPCGPRNVRRHRLRGVLMPTILFDRIDEPGLNTLRRLRAPRRLSAAAQGAVHDARGGARRDHGLGHPRPRRRRASRWAARSRSCPTGTWTSTWSATPTSPSRARSRTAS